MKLTKTLRRGRLAACLTGTLLAAGLATSVLGNESANPYLAIIERNPFGLKPLPPPPDPNATQEEVKQPPCKVTLTGITSMFGPDSKRALLEITETEQGKNNVRKPNLGEGQRDGSVEVLAIDIANNKVRIRNSDIEAELTFEKPKPPPAAPTPPGGVPPPVPSRLGHPATGVAAANPTGIGGNTTGVTPLIVSRNSGNESGNSGVVLMGGDQPAPAPTAQAAALTGGGTMHAATGTSYAAGNNTGLNLANFPRTVRTGTPAAQSARIATPANNPYANLPPLTPEQRALNATMMNMLPGKPPVPGGLPPSMLGEN